MRRLVTAGLGLTALSTLCAFVGCATEGSPEAPPIAVVDAQAVLDTGPSDVDAEAGRCAADDCVTYPLDCTDRTLCPVPVAFDKRADLFDLWASGPSDVWAAGSLGTVVHYDGTTWQPVSTGRKETFRAVWGTDPGNVWVAGSNDFLLHAQSATLTSGTWDVFDVYDGTNQACPISGMWGSTSKGIWGALQCVNAAGMFASPVNAALHSAGWQADGGPSWEAEYQLPDIVSATFDIHSIFGFGEQDVWLGGSDGVLFRRKLPLDAGKDAAVDDTPEWLEVNSRAVTTINGIGGVDANDVWLVGDTGLIRRWDGTTMNTLELPAGIPQNNLEGVWVANANDVWLVGEGALLIHYDGANFNRIPVAGLGAVLPTFRKVWASDATHEIWVVGDGLLLGGKTSTLQ